MAVEREVDGWSWPCSRSTIPVSWNTANFAANGTVGALLLHHLGVEGRRAEVVPVKLRGTP